MFPAKRSYCAGIFHLFLSVACHQLAMQSWFFKFRMSWCRGVDSANQGAVFLGHFFTLASDPQFFMTSHCCTIFSASEHDCPQPKQNATTALSLALSCYDMSPKILPL